MPGVIVIGAGMAGLSAANHFVNRGFNDVVILEARDRIGGRMFTYRKYVFYALTSEIFQISILTRHVFIN